MIMGETYDFKDFYTISSGTSSPMDLTQNHYSGSMNDTHTYKRPKIDHVSSPPAMSDPPNYAHTYYASNPIPKSRRGSSPSSYNDENKICQWYCCSCGQSYGSVLYKDADGNVETREEHNRKNQDSTTNYILDNLKYYSQVVYRDHINSMTSVPPPPNITTQDITRPLYKSTTSEPIYSNCKEPKPLIPKYIPQTPPSPAYNPATPLMSPISTELQNSNTINYQERIIISAPTRFTCHRCNHMMCPYCPKLRLKDLDH